MSYRGPDSNKHWLKKERKNERKKERKKEKKEKKKRTPTTKWLNYCKVYYIPAYDNLTMMLTTFGNKTAQLLLTFSSVQTLERDCFHFKTHPDFGFWSSTHQANTDSFEKVTEILQSSCNLTVGSWQSSAFTPQNGLRLLGVGSAWLQITSHRVQKDWF